MDRQPCPWRIYDDIGSAFTMGTIVGGVFHLFNGMKNSARGERFRGGLRTMSQRGPVIGGNFAMWGGLFSSFDCLLLHIRKKEDIYNSISSGFLTGACIAWRGGFKVALRNGIFGGIFLAMIEGVMLVFQKAEASRQLKTSRIPPPPRSGGGIVGDKRNCEFDFIQMGNNNIKNINNYDKDFKVNTL